MMVTFNQVVKESPISGRSVDTEGTRASRIAEEIVEGFVIERKCSMNRKSVYDRPI